MIRGKLLAAASAAVILGHIFGAQAASMEEELRALVAQHPRIKSNESQVSAADKGVKATLAPFLPSIDVTGGAGYEHISTPSFRASPTGPFDTDAENYALTLRENLFDGDKKFANRRAAKLQREVANFSLTNTRQTVLLEGATTYLNVLRQTELVQLSTQNGDNIRRQLNLEDERVRRGSGIAVDVLQAKSRLQISLERLVASQGAREDARSRYLQVHGHLPPDAAMTLPPPVERMIPASLDEAVNIAFAENSNIASFDRRIDIGVQQKSVIEAEYYPSIDLVVQDKLEQNFNGLPGKRRDHTVKVQATWNLFGGFGTNSRAAQQAFDNEARRNDYVDARRKVEEQTRLAWQSLQTATARVALLDNAVNIASEVFASRTKLREAGKETVINVLDAENEVFSARINYTSALYDARIAAYQLLAAIGRLEITNVTQPVVGRMGDEPATVAAAQAKERVSEKILAPAAAESGEHLAAAPSPVAEVQASANVAAAPAYEPEAVKGAEPAAPPPETPPVQLAAAPAAPEPTPAPVFEPASASESAAAPPVHPVGAPALAAQTLPAGAYQIQLASFRAEATAQAEWARVSERFKDLLGPLTPAITKAELADRGTHFRLRAGPLADKAAADSVCNALAADQIGCLVIQP